MLSYALDVWRVSWITAASKAQSRLLAVPEDTALQKKKKTERKRKGEIFIKLASHQQEACLSNILHVFVLGGLVEVLQTVAACCICSSYCWPVSKTITGRLLHAFMKYSNGCMSYCALIMPHKDRKEGRGQTQMGRQEEIMKERCIYWNVEK